MQSGSRTLLTICFDVGLVLQENMVCQFHGKFFETEQSFIPILDLFDSKCESFVHFYAISGIRAKYAPLNATLIGQKCSKKVFFPLFCHSNLSSSFLYSNIIWQITSTKNSEALSAWMHLESWPTAWMKTIPFGKRYALHNGIRIKSVPGKIKFFMSEKYLVE